MRQITLNFDASHFDGYPSCREYVARQVHQQSVPQKAIAMDMDYSPSQLTRKLAQADNSRFTLDDLETFVRVTEDVSPIYYLIEKHITGTKSKDRLLKLREEIESQLAALEQSAA